MFFRHKKSPKTEREVLMEELTRLGRRGERARYNPLTWLLQIYNWSGVQIVAPGTRMAIGTDGGVLPHRSALFLGNRVEFSLTLRYGFLLPRNRWAYLRSVPSNELALLRRIVTHSADLFRRAEAEFIAYAGIEGDLHETDLRVTITFNEEQNGRWDIEVERQDNPWGVVWYIEFSDISFVRVWAAN